MRYLLDTHVLLWLTMDAPLLSSAVKKIFLSESNELCLSKASLWEMAVKAGLKKLDLGGTLKDFVQTHVLPNGISILDLSVEHIYAVERLEWLHRDPFDRLLVAQAVAERIPILTDDEQIRRYPVKTVF